MAAANGALRIYAVADLHGRPERLELVRKTVEELRPDAVVAAGDLSNYRRAGLTAAALGDLSAPVLAVRGNTDFPRLERYIAARPGVESLDRRRIELGGFGFVGLSGTIPVPFDSRVRLWQKPLFQALAPLVDRETVLVAHPPPFGTLDGVFGRFHAGCRRLAVFVVERRPRALICGHIHESAGAAWLGETLVVNCSLGRSGRGALIEMTPGLRPRATML